MIPLFTDETEDTQIQSVDPLRQLSNSSLAAELSIDILGSSNASEPSLVRSLSSDSLVSLDPPYSEAVGPDQNTQEQQQKQQQVSDIQKQLAAVRAQLGHQGSLDEINDGVTDVDFALVPSESSDDIEGDTSSAPISNCIFSLNNYDVESLMFFYISYLI